MHECYRQATQPFRILGKRDKVVMETMICDEHNAAVERGVPCVYKDPPGALYIIEPSSSPTS